MIIKIVAVGRLRERYWQQAVADYARRLQSYARVEMVEIPAAPISLEATPAEEARALAKEGEVILEKLSRHSGPLIALDRQGKALDSLQLANWLQQHILEGNSQTAWIIGGPLGLAPEVLAKADLVLSFSRMTFPHQMMRLILLEQIYRSFRIMRHEPYHK